MLFQLTICAAMQDHRAVLRKQAASRCSQTNADGESAGRWRSEQCLGLCSDEEEGTVRRIPFLRRKTRCRMPCASSWSLTLFRLRRIQSDGVVLVGSAARKVTMDRCSSTWVGYVTLFQIRVCRSARASGLWNPRASAAAAKPPSIAAAVIFRMVCANCGSPSHRAPSAPTARAATDLGRRQKHAGRRFRVCAESAEQQDTRIRNELTPIRHGRKPQRCIGCTAMSMSHKPELSFACPELNTSAAHAKARGNRKTAIGNQLPTYALT
jgi:hypothetical protein